MSGDTIQTGNISGVGIAVGAGASVTIYGDIYYYPIALQAPLREELARHMVNQHEYDRGYAAYGAWLARRAYGAINSEVSQARQMLEAALEKAVEQPGTDAHSSLLYELASIYQVQGDIPRALGLYQESLAIFEQLGDQQGKSASAHDSEPLRD